MLAYTSQGTRQDASPLRPHDKGLREKKKVGLVIEHRPCISARSHSSVSLFDQSFSSFNCAAFPPGSLVVATNSTPYIPRLTRNGRADRLLGRLFSARPPPPQAEVFFVLRISGIAAVVLLLRLTHLISSRLLLCSPFIDILYSHSVISSTDQRPRRALLSLLCHVCHEKGNLEDVSYNGLRPFA
ncbi:hypothetical protein G7K_4676-t1 [Saitoella complicata NRRL Y-17804]|uniref:Uncharacterized protein n=1 Tax=Saitoella complicata (strain BCRC 22490 / CBS 7301 / JCM 7358 / NBRC 10748 / NRRL Y-17804) TaxID=698492 RepID=A0A0E9NKZ6_SAICN|nr:hypothetical protein G7K_4676-t1 [Saitoella complicata NRRL Y-17804]